MWTFGAAAPFDQVGQVCVVHIFGADDAPRGASIAIAVAHSIRAMRRRMAHLPTDSVVAAHMINNCRRHTLIQCISSYVYKLKNALVQILTSSANKRTKLWPILSFSWK
uniref:Uncharacterized protein n=1 Tax=Rhizobium leguminosarum TaxID=384 RepID=A0A154IP50_RHILE|nr:hypothetical protein A4A59_10595 [Rhizobium leguminosarum]